MKDLIGLDPHSWLALFGVGLAGLVTSVPTDLSSTILMEADHVFRIEGPRPWLVQIEFQSTRNARLIARMNLYSSLLERRHRLSVQSLLVLLRPEADSRAFSGHHERQLPGGRVYRTFDYDVIRIWEQPIETLLAGPLPTLPLALLAGLTPSEAVQVLRRIETRIRSEAPADLGDKVRANTYLLLGLRFPDDVVEDLIRGVGNMAGALKESSTYQKILREGREEGIALGLEQGRADGVREALITLGTSLIGPPDAATSAALHRITDPIVLTDLTVRIISAKGWDDLGLT